MLVSSPPEPSAVAPPFASISERLRLILPALYRAREEEVQPVSMGSAGLKYGPDGKVAWGEIWGSFCDLALAGGPPHRGTLLEAGCAPADLAEGERLREVEAELCRGIGLVTGLFAAPGPQSGSVRMYCTSAAMAAWLARAIVAENVSARFEGLSLFLPAGPGFRVERECKNVITAVAKTTHYWMEHTPPEQQAEIAGLLRAMDAESPLLAPGAADEGSRGRLGEAITAACGLHPTQHGSAGWLGLQCPSVRAAVWMMRLLIVRNVFSRREEDVVFVPVNTGSDPAGEVALHAVTEAHRYARDADIL